MMKFLVAFCVLAVVAPSISVEMKCSVAGLDMPTEWADLRGDCLSGMRHQIQKEIDASYKYLALGAYFSRDTVNRPGFAEMYFKAAREEREHGSKLIEYLSMRGELVGTVTDLIKRPIIEKSEWTNCEEGLKDALKLETEVTKSIRKIIQTCERKVKFSEQKQYNYAHLVDYLTGVYLDEQLHGQRELAGKLSTLGKMMTNNGALGEFLYDKELQTV